MQPSARVDIDELPRHPAVGALLRDISHAMRSPLNAVGGFARLALADADASTAALLTEITVAADGLTQVADAVLDLGRIADGAIVPARSPVSVTELSDRVWAMVGVTDPPGPPVGGDAELLVDADLLTRCISSVWKAPLRAGLLPRTRVETDGCGHRLVFDWSTGEDRRCIPTAIDRMRADGLAAVQGGRVDWVGDARPTGAIVTIRSLDALQVGRVLVVEDDQAGAELLRSLVARVGGAEVVLVSSVEEARRAMGLVRFDAAVVDLVLHGGSGWSVVAALRERSAAARIAVLTAEDQPGTQSDVERYRPDAFFRKPADIAELRRFLGDALTTAGG